MATIRGYYREELRRARAALDLAYKHLDRFRVTYEADHPDYAEVAKVIIDMLATADEVIAKLHDEI